jgi:hypothetical protein
VFFREGFFRKGRGGGGDAARLVPYKGLYKESFAKIALDV